MYSNIKIQSAYHSSNIEYSNYFNSIANDYAMADFFDEKTGLRGYFTSERQTNSPELFLTVTFSTKFPSQSI